jgi:hypothetical protein
MTSTRFDELQARFGGRRQFTRHPEVRIAVCAWCPDFDATDPRNDHASHGMCPACAAAANLALDNLERETT